MTAPTPEREAEIRAMLSSGEPEDDRPLAAVADLLAALDATRAELAEANKRAEQLGEALDNALTRHGVALEQLEEIAGVCDAHGARSRASPACAVRLLAGENVGGETLPHARDLALLAEVRGRACRDLICAGLNKEAVYVREWRYTSEPHAEALELLVRLLRGEG